jgi:flavodoxin
MSRSIKKALTATALLASATMISALCACNGQEQAKQNETAAAPQQTKSVIVYFSQTGTTKKLAGALKQAVNADEIELKLVNAYPSTYDSTIAMVGAQRESKQWPELSNAKLDLAKYDTVYLGYPIMFGSFAPPIYTFLDSNDLSGKVVVPFCTYGSGGRKASASELKELEPNANVTLAMGVSNKRMTKDDGDSIAKAEVETFLANLAAGKTDEMLMGGFSEQRPLTAEDSAVFATATKDYGYLQLKPLSVSTQVVAGTNYLFLCTMSGFNRPPTETMVKIFRPLPGRGEPELIVVEK